MSGIPTFVEYDILCLDAERGISYSTFDEFWDKRMEPMQYISPDAKGPFAHLREILRERAREQYYLHWQHRLAMMPQGALAEAVRADV
jgi:hypothetical protein